MKTITTSPLVLIASAVLAVSPVASAATLVDYQFASATPTSSAANTTAGDAAWVGVGPTGVGFGGSTQTAYARTDQVPSTMDTGKYLTFTLSANATYALNLDSFTFDLGGTTNASSTLDVHTQVRTSVDGYASSLTLTPGPTTEASKSLPVDTTTPSFTTFTASLDSSFDNLSTVTFRLYVYETSTSTSIYYRFDNFAVNGSVVPEPGTGLLLAASALAFLGVRGRRFRRS